MGPTITGPNWVWETRKTGPRRPFTPGTGRDITSTRSVSVHGPHSTIHAVSGYVGTYSEWKTLRHWRARYLRKLGNEGKEPHPSKKQQKWTQSPSEPGRGRVGERRISGSRPYGDGGFALVPCGQNFYECRGAFPAPAVPACIRPEAFCTSLRPYAWGAWISVKSYLIASSLL